MPSTSHVSPLTDWFILIFAIDNKDFFNIKFNICPSDKRLLKNEYHAVGDT